MLCLCLLPACGDSNGDEPDNPNPVNPDKEVADPAGTVKLSMRSEAAVGDNKTELDGCLWIDDADNFYVYDGSIVDLGSMKGLGNVGYIPKTGYVKKVAVTPGNGYVMHNEDSGVFYRIYVSNYTKNAVGEIIGADIKYQKPFYGIDEELSLSKTELEFNALGNSKFVKIENNSFIPVTISSSKQWCQVKLSRNEGDKFYSGVSINVEQAQTMIDDVAEVTLKTKYGKTAKISVKRNASTPVIKAPTGAYIPPFECETTFGFFSNIPYENLKVSSDEEWLSVELSRIPGEVVFANNIINDDTKANYYVIGKAKTSGQGKRSVTISITDLDGKTYAAISAVQEPAYIDLGLSVKWATCNLGALSSIFEGDYYAWGAISPKVNNEFCHNDKYNDVLSPDQDIATISLGSPWRMPTKDEFEELITKCQWSEQNGTYLIKGPSGNSIKLPKAYYYYNYYLVDRYPYRYWTSSSYIDRYGRGRFAYFFDDKSIEDTNYSNEWMPIRPVRP